MKNELISMVELIDQHKGKFKTMSNGDYAPQMAEKLDLYEDYATFLNTPLNISMFVPAIDGEVITGDEYSPNGEITVMYQTAKDNVIFEGFEVKTGVVTDYAIFNNSRGITKIMLNNKTIQDLIKYKPTLTKKGVYVSGLNR